MVIALVNWVQIARVVYTETSSLAEREFIEASRAHRRRAVAHPAHPRRCRIWCRRCWSGARSGIATTVLLEATLSFLGVGVRPPTPSWGNIIYENQTWFATAPWLVFIPGCRDPAAGPGLQSCRRRAARRARPDPARARLMGPYLARRLGQALFILLGITLVTYRPALSPAGRPGAPDRRAQRHARGGREHPPPARPRSAAVAAISALSRATCCRAISAAPTSRRPRSRR